MSEPGHDTVAEWILKALGWCAAAALAGLGAAMGWFRTARLKLEASIQQLADEHDKEFVTVWADMRARTAEYARHSQEIAVLQAHQENNVTRLQDIQDTTRDTNQKVDMLSNKLTDVLVAIQSKR